MTTHRFLIGWLACCAGVWSVTVCEAGPLVSVVMQDDAPPLEKHAAKELAAQWKQLFDADVQIGPTPATDAVATILLGSPATNAAVKTALGDKWPKLTDQGHLIRTVTTEKNTAVVGGGSPVATLWAVYELSHHFGVRSLLHGDFYPVETPKLSVEKLDIVLEPTFSQRSFRTFDVFPMGFAMWGVEDQKRLFRQLSKLKFNRVVLNYPFLTLAPPTRVSIPPTMAFMGPILVTGDMPGRAAFRGTKKFENPDLPFDKTDSKSIQAGNAYIQQATVSAQELGFTVGLDLSVRLITKQELRLGFLTNVLKVFPDLNAVYLTLSQVKGVDPFCTEELPRLRESFPKLEWQIMCNAEAAADVPKDVVLVAQENQMLDAHPADGRRIGSVVPGSQVFSVLPDLSIRPLEESLRVLREKKANGFFVTAATPADIDPAVYFLSRAAFQSDLLFAAALPQLITPICGEGVVDRVAQALQMIDEAAAILLKEAPKLGTWDEKSILGSDLSPDAEWPSKVRVLYANAMNEMYRANSRSRGGARAITLYYAKRCEFGLHFMTCVEGVLKARKPGLSRDEVTEQLEAAHEALYAAQNALAEVARDQSDRGIIAVVNEFGYRPLKKALEEP